MPNLTVDFWETFDFASLSTANLAANDNISGGNWSITDLGATLSVNAASEKLTPGTINGGSDASGSAGFRYASNSSYVEGIITYALPAAKATLSWGCWFKYPASFLGTFNGGEPDIFYLENTALAVREPYVKLEDDGSSRAMLAYFTPEDGQDSNVVRIKADTWYWLTGKYVAGGTHLFRVYDASGNWIGKQLTRSAASAGNCDQISVGSLIGDEGTASKLYEFDDWIIDWTSANFPLGPPAADGAFFIGNSTGATIGTAASTWSLATPTSLMGGGAIIVGIGLGSSVVAVSTVTDNTTNVYTKVVALVSSTKAVGAEMWYCNRVSSASTRISVTLSGASSGAIGCLNVAGMSTGTPVDVTGSSAIAANSTSHSASQITPSSNNALIVSFAYMNASTIGRILNTPIDMGTWISTATAVRTHGMCFILDTPSTQTGFFNTSSGCRHASVIAAFNDTNAIAAGGGGGRHRYWSFTFTGVQSAHV